MSQAQSERDKLVNASNLHGIHWFVIALSVGITLAAWYFSKIQHEQRSRLQFERQSEHIVELITERLRKYEDALWAGVGVIAALDSSVKLDNWVAFTNTLNINHKYPGINGIGVIHAVTQNELPDYLLEQKKIRPDFDIFPFASRELYLPITFIEPISQNASAVGLDVAHEKNRQEAALKSRDTGTAQITAPIILVQDQDQMPGFLFYAPFYESQLLSLTGNNSDAFHGLVYAAFVVRNLMNGTLNWERRDVNLKLSDGDHVLYNEYTDNNDNFDKAALFEQSVDVEFYGRVWSFSIRSGLSFRDLVNSKQSSYILIGGLTIDFLLFYLFLSISRSYRKALVLVDTSTTELKSRAQRLARSNADLEQFAYVSSHDLQEPLRMVGNFTQLLQEQYKGRIDDQADQYIHYAVNGVKRMQRLLNELLQYARVTADEQPFAETDCNAACDEAIAQLKLAIAEVNANIVVGALPTLNANHVQLVLVFQHLISNGLKYHSSSESVNITIDSVEVDDGWRFSVSDNGIGISENHLSKIFVIFQRLHQREEYSGTGIGLSIVKKIIENHDGNIWVESEEGQGSQFYFTLPKI